MSIDVIGINPVANLIRQSGLTKFIIYREGAGKGSTPVFENIFCDSNPKTVTSFTDWASNLLNSNPVNTTVYDIFLFDERALIDEEESEAEEGEDIKRPLRSKKKANKIRFRFQLASNNMMQGMNGQQNSNYVTKEDMGKIVTEALIAAEGVRANNEILNRLKALEEDDEDDEDDQDFDSSDSLGRIEKIFDRVEGLITKKKIKDKSEENELELADSVSGVEDIKKKTGRDVKKNINLAITKLYKYDKDLDLDLLKFAELAEKDTEQFKTFIKALRAM